MARTPEQLRELMRSLPGSSMEQVTELARKFDERRRKSCIKSGWRTIEPPYRFDWGPFNVVRDVIEAELRKDPAQQVSQLLDWLIVEYPGKFHRSQLKTLKQYVFSWLCLYKRGLLPVDSGWVI